MELQQYIQIIRKRLLLVLIVTLSITLLSAIVSYFVIKPSYKATINVLIGENSNKSGEKDDYNNLLKYQKQVKTYGEFAKTKLVATDVINELKLDMTEDDLVKMITVTPKGDTEFLTISVKSKNAEEAAKIANQLVLSLKKISSEKKNVDNVIIVDSAVAPKHADSPKPLLNTAVAFFLGIMVSVGVIFLLEYLDNTVKDEDDIAKLLDASVIGIIPVMEGE